MNNAKEGDNLLVWLIRLSRGCAKQQDYAAAYE
jgi:hypothetical protein